MTIKHTPGPWLYRAKSSAVYGPPPADTPFTYGEHYFSFRDEEEPSDPDLALILAAPDLLEAVKNLLWYITQLEAIVYEPDDTGEHEEVTAANAAIAKATGESQ